MKWTPEKIESVRAAIARIREARTRQEQALRALEFQMALAEQGIDPAEVAGVGPGIEGQHFPFWQAKKFERLAYRVLFKDGREIDLKTPLPYDFETRKE